METEHDFRAVEMLGSKRHLPNQSEDPSLTLGTYGSQKELIPECPLSSVHIYICATGTQRRTGTPAPPPPFGRVL